MSIEVNVVIRGQFATRHFCDINCMCHRDQCKMGCVNVYQSDMTLDLIGVEERSTPTGWISWDEWDSDVGFIPENWFNQSIIKLVRVIETNKRDKIKKYYLLQKWVKNDLSYNVGEIDLRNRLQNGLKGYR